MLDTVTGGDSLGVTENYLDRKTVHWLSIGGESGDTGTRGTILQYVAVAGILPASFLAKTSILRALSLYSNNI